MYNQISLKQMRGIRFCKYSYILLVGAQTAPATMEISVDVPGKSRNSSYSWSSYSLLRIPKDSAPYHRDICLHLLTGL